MNLVAPVADLTCDIKKEAGAIRSLESLADLRGCRVRFEGSELTGQGGSVGVHDSHLQLHWQQGRHWG